jgi:hypothetical protein
LNNGASGRGVDSPSQALRDQRASGVGQIALEPLDQSRLSYARLTGDQDKSPFTLARFARVLAQRGQHRIAFQQGHNPSCTSKTSSATSP